MNTEVIKAADLNNSHIGRWTSEKREILEITHKPAEVMIRYHNGGPWYHAKYETITLVDPLPQVYIIQCADGSIVYSSGLEQAQGIFHRIRQSGFQARLIEMTDGKVLNESEDSIGY